MSITREECRRFLDDWGDQAFEDPALGRRLADHGLEMVGHLGDPPDLRARALANQGSSYRAIGGQSRAEELYREARRIYCFLILSTDLEFAQRHQAALDYADLERRWAYLRMEQRLFPEALEKVATAERVFLAAKDFYNVGRAQLARGVILIERGQPEEAIPWLGRVLTMLDPEQHSKASHAAAHNLQLALAEAEPDPEGLEVALQQVTEGRLSRASRRPSRSGSVNRQLMGRRRRSLPDAKARGLQGRILVMLSQHEPAQRLLESAREDLIDLEALLDAAAVDIELAECYLRSGKAHRWDQVEELVKEALDLLALVPIIPETLAALRLWHKAVSERSLNRTLKLIQQCRVQLLKPNIFHHEEALRHE